jgi:glyoxylase-like metal-dependent hydrolase (beta-lactamase superfamily II)
MFQASTPKSFDPNPQGKLPQSLFQGAFAFPPNRDTLGGTAYWFEVNGIGNRDESTCRVLVDCPRLNGTNQEFLQQRGVDWLFLTHRGGMGQVKAWQQVLGCGVVVQEQEAYLLPNLEVRSFQYEIALAPGLVGLWTAGHSPGSACLYWPNQGGILFSGRHLLPLATGAPAPLRTSKTFHWPRQLRNVQMLLDRFTPETLHYICPGASIGLLRGKLWIDRAYDRLSQLNLVV